MRLPRSQRRGRGAGPSGLRGKFRPSCASADIAVGHRLFFPWPSLFSVAMCAPWPRSFLASEGRKCCQSSERKKRLMVQSGISPGVGESGSPRAGGRGTGSYQLPKEVAHLSRCLSCEVSAEGSAPQSMLQK